MHKNSLDCRRNFPWRHWFAIYIGGSICMGCQVLPGATNTPTSVPVLAITVQVDTAAVIRAAIPAGLFGVNVEWIEKVNGMASNAGVFDSGWSNLAHDGGVDHVRWPGGIFSDYYHWKDGIGPVSSRPLVPHHTGDNAYDTDVVGTTGIAAWAQSFGAKLLCTVNAGLSIPADSSNGSPSEAADWVRYCNDPSDARRIADGFASPLNVSLWEIGNELYLSGNPGTPSVYMDASTYAARFMQFAAAMRAAVPATPINIMAIGEANSSWYKQNDTIWIDTLLASAATQIDFLAVHNAYHPVLYNNAEAGRSAQEVYQAFWAAPESVGASLDRLSAKLALTEAANGLAAGKIGLAITEWGPLFGGNALWVDQVKTMGSAVYVARLFQVFFEHERLRIADAFKFTDSSTQGWIGYDTTPKPIWYVFSLFARQKGYAVLSTSVVGSASYSTAQVGSVAATQNLPEVTAQTTLSPDGKTLAVSLVNRSWNGAYDISLNLPAGWDSSNATLNLISAAGVSDHNGPDVQSWIPAQLYLNPARIGAVNFSTTVVGTMRRFHLPPFSVAVIELQK